MNPATLFFIVSTVISLTLVIIFLPRMIDYINRSEPHFIMSSVSGFEDMPSIPQEATSSTTSSSTEMRCGNSICEEGSFCDTLTQTCVARQPATSGDTMEGLQGYFS